MLYVGLFFPLFYDSASLSDSLLAPIWFILDADIYLKVLLFTSFADINQKLVGFLYNYFFGITYTPANREVRSPSDFTIPKHLAKPLLYKLLTSKYSKDLPDEALEQLLNTYEKPNANLVELQAQLFKLLYTTALLDTSYLQLRRDVVTLTSTGTSPVQASDLLSTHEYLPLLLSHSLKTSGLTTPTSREFSQWSLTDLTDESKLYVVERAIYGDMVLSNTTFSKIGVLPYNVSSRIVSNQLATIKQQRWLYKYSVLHRKVLNFTGKLTAAKRLLGAGFVTSDMESRNLWVASNMSSAKFDVTKNAQIFKNIYGTYLDLESLAPHLTPTQRPFLNSSVLSSLSAYESSYVWFIKRFYLLNTLPTHSMVQTPSLSRPILHDLVSSESEKLISNQNTTPLYTTSLKSSKAITANQSVPYNTASYLSDTDASVFNKTSIAVMSDLARNNSASQFKFFTVKPIK